MENPKPAPIFINYRRKISQKDANSITAELQAHFGQEAVFQDTTMEPGKNWKVEIAENLENCKILVALIGKDWLECQYAETNKERGWKKGRCRLDNPEDYVRIEIEEAIKAGKKIIPVLIDRKQFDKEEDFPEGSELVNLLELTTVNLRSGEFKDGIAKLIPTIEKFGINRKQEQKQQSAKLFQLHKEYPLPPDMILASKTPFVGLRPFTEDEAPLFFGRSKEIYDLCFSIDQHQDHQVILFYGLSGVGKSSLLRAGAMPRLEEKGWQPLYGRREEDPGRGLSGLLQSLLRKAGKGKNPAVLFIDQVEEAITDPIEGFEEEFITFFDELKEATGKNKQLKFVLAFRSEYLPQVRDQLNDIAFNDKLFIKPLDQEGLREAIAGLSKSERLGDFLFDAYSLEEGLPEKILDDILQDEASNRAPLLQAQLLDLWKEARKEKPLGKVVISERHYWAIGYESLARLLDRQLKLIGENFEDVVKNGLALDILYLFTTRRDTAAVHPDTDIYKHYPKEMAEPLILALEKHYLLLRFNDLDEQPHTRLAHDALAPIIRDEYDHSDRVGQRARRIVEAKIREIANNPGMVSGIFSEADVEILIEGKPYMQLVQPDFWEVVENDHANFRRQRLRRFTFAFRGATRHLEHLEYNKAFDQLKVAQYDRIHPEFVFKLALHLPFFFIETRQNKLLLECLHFISGYLSDSSPAFRKLFELAAGNTQDKKALKRNMQECNPLLFKKMRDRHFPEMIEINGGAYKMGNKDGYNDEKPEHKVQVSTFQISATPVTFWQYGLYCKSVGKDLPNDSGFGRGDKPVINVNWYEAIEYCNWLSALQEGVEPVYQINGETVHIDWNKNGYRLPTEAEWEYAAREGGKNVRFGNGKDVANPDEMNFDAGHPYNEKYAAGWYVEGKSRKATTAVSKFKPNALGLYDMSGNVWEWCWDKWSEGDYYKESDGSTDPTGPEESSEYSRTVRGGSWFNIAGVCRCSYRIRYIPINQYDDVGFRVVRRLPS